MSTRWTSDLPLTTSIGNLDEFLIRQAGTSGFALVTMADLRTAMTAPAYDRYITDTVDDGNWGESASHWQGATPLGTASSSPGSRTLVGISFPLVAINPATTISSATLSLNHKAISGLYFPSAWSIYGDTPAASSVRWSQTSPPPGTSIGSLAAISAPTVDTTTNHDVTTMVQAMINHVNWSAHDFIRFWISIDTSTPGSLMGFGGPDLAGSTAARLVIEL